MSNYIDLAIAAKSVDILPFSPITEKISEIDDVIFSMSLNG